MKKSKWDLANWRSWAEVGTEVLPYIKEEDTRGEVAGTENIMGIKDRRIRILDVCCGWGRHCLELASHGYQNIYGVDISKAFIEYAENKDRQGNVEFIWEDVMRLKFREKFDMAVSFWHSIGFYETGEENLNFFRKIYALLKFSGTFLIDAANGDRDLQRMKYLHKNDCMPGNRHWWYVKERNMLGLTEAIFDIKKKIVEYQIFAYKVAEPDLKKKDKREIANQAVNTVGLFYDDDYIPGNRHWHCDGNRGLVLSEIRKPNGNKRDTEYQIYEDLVHLDVPLLSTERVPLRIYTKAELTRLLKSAGFRICNVYGDFHKGEYFIESPRLIVVAQKR